MTTVAIILGIALAIWGCVSAARGSLLVGCVALLVVACCFGYRLVSFTVGPWRLTLDRLMLVGLVAGYVMSRWSGRADPKPIRKAEVVLGVLLAVLAVSTFTADWRDAGPGQARPWWRLVAGYVFPAIVYWVARQTPLTERRVRATCEALAGFATYLAATGVFEVSQQWWLVFPPYIADPHLGRAFGCARGPMLSPVTFGLYVGVGMLSAWLWAAHSNGVRRWLVYALLPLFLMALFFSYTRGVWLGMWLGLLTVFALTLRRYWRAAVLGGMVAAGLFVVTVKWDTLMGFQRGRETARGTRQSAILRLSFTYVSWRMFLDRPWFGVHFGHFPDAKLPYLTDRSTSLDLEAIRPYSHHNTFLSLLTETGLIGLGSFLTLLWYWARTAWRIWRDTRAPEWVRMPGALLLGTLGIYIGPWLFHELSFAPIDHGLLFLVAGIAAGVDARRNGG